MSKVIVQKHNRRPGNWKIHFFGRFTPLSVLTSASEFIKIIIGMVCNFGQTNRKFCKK